MGIRTKLFLFSLIAIVVMGGASGAYLQNQLRAGYESRLEIQLEEKARMTASAMPLLVQGDSNSQIHALDAWVDKVASGARSRITVIDREGIVLADSLLDGAALIEVENHGARPEIRDAYGGEVGVAWRYSTTASTNMLYVAVSSPQDGPVVRLAMPTHEVDAAADRLRLILLAAAGLGLFFASAVGGLASYFAARTLRAIVESAKGLSKGGHTRVGYSSRDELGVLAGSINTLADELEKNVVSLREERDRMETILRGTSEGVLALDADRRIRLVNSAATRLLNLPPNIEGLPIFEASREPGLLALAEKGTTEAHTAELRTGDPQRVLLGSADPLKATGGTVLVLHDVTEMRRMETIRRDFVANVSHELRTPVSVIQANSETLLDGALDDPRARITFVEAIERNSIRLGRLIADLLDLARIEAGSQDIRREQLCVHDCAEHALLNLQRPARLRSISLTLDVPKDVIVWADDKALEQVLVNYVENAIKYTQDGGTIRIIAFSEENLVGRPAKPVSQSPSQSSFPVHHGGAFLDRVRILVEDDGPGIPEHSLNRVFERFYRVDKGRSQKLGGTGLGLSIVKHLAQIMGGQVGVQNRKPRGSSFWISLPAREEPASKS